MVIEQLLEVAGDADTSVIVVGLKGGVAEMIATLGVLRTVPEERVVENLAQARGIARRLLGD